MITPHLPPALQFCPRAPSLLLLQFLALFTALMFSKAWGGHCSKVTFSPSRAGRGSSRGSMTYPPLLFPCIDVTVRVGEAVEESALQAPFAPSPSLRMVLAAEGRARQLGLLKINSPDWLP